MLYQSKKAISQAVNVAQDMEMTDISQREEVIVSEVINLTNGEFVPSRILWRSDYFGTGKVGAFHYLGTYKGKLTVLKIQGAKPLISEESMIKDFTRQNLSKIIRAPHLYKVIPWSEQKGYEALIMEFASGEKILSSKKLLNFFQINDFFNIYQEYRKNALTKPWLPKPKPNLKDSFEKLLTVAQEVKPDSPFRKPGDSQLIRRALAVLTQVWIHTDLEFQHGHLSAEDLIKQDNQVIIFSNLFWKWKFPYYDAVFAYHWIMYELASIKNVSALEIEEQRELWLKVLYQLPQVKNDSQKKLLTAALLERAIVGLLIDAFAYIDESNLLAEHIVISTRREVTRLIKELETK